MSSDKEANALRDIVALIDQIDAYIDGSDFTQFADDRKGVRAVERCLQNLREAVVLIGEARWSVFAPTLAFHLVLGLGNRPRREYDRIDVQSIFELAETRLDELCSVCVKALSDD